MVSTAGDGKLSTGCSGVAGARRLLTLLITESVKEDSPFCLTCARCAGARATSGCAWSSQHLQGHLAHKKTHPPRTIPQAYAYAPVGFLGGWAFFMGEVSS